MLFFEQFYSNFPVCCFNYAADSWCNFGRSLQRNIIFYKAKMECTFGTYGSLKHQFNCHQFIVVYLIKVYFVAYFQVWFKAVGQCFFSLSTGNKYLEIFKLLFIFYFNSKLFLKGFGPIIMFASYNPFRHNANRLGMNNRISTRHQVVNYGKLIMAIVC